MDPYGTVLLMALGCLLAVPAVGALVGFFVAKSGRPLLPWTVGVLSVALFVAMQSPIAAFLGSFPFVLAWFTGTMFGARELRRRRRS